MISILIESHPGTPGTPGAPGAPGLGLLTGALPPMVANLLNIPPEQVHLTLVEISTEQLRRRQREQAILLASWTGC